MATMEAPAQHKQPSRKGKKAWRKNVDLTEVQSGLEVVRDEVIKGGIIAEKPSEELFAFDTTGDVEIKKAYNKGHKPLKADEILAQRSAVPALDSRKRPASRITDGIVPTKKQRSGGVSHKEYERLRKIAYGGDAVEKDVVKSAALADHDPWAMEEALKDPQFTFLEKKKRVKAPETMKHAPLSLAANGKPFPAVKKPEAGKSYNPTFEAWDELITREGEKELEAEKKRLKQAQEEQERMERALAAAAEPDNESDGAESAWESEWEGIQSEPEADWLNKKRPERKTPAQRNKIKRRKEAERKAKWEAKMKEKEEQAAKVKALKKLVEEKEKTRAQSKPLVDAGSDASSDEAEEVLHKKRRFGKAPIPEAPLEVVLADELQESLRLLKPEGNLLKDRFRNLLLNGKVESRRPMQHKKAKVTVSEKWTYKDWKLDRK